MSVKRFVGASARECLRRVKEEMGPDAVVISNKPSGNGVEVVAMTPDSLDAIIEQTKLSRITAHCTYSRVRFEFNGDGLRKNRKDD